MTTFPHHLERQIVVRAPRAVVFRYFTDSARFAAWWGAGSRIDARVGGEVRIQMGGTVVRGEVLHLEADRSIAFTYGYEDPSKPIPVGGSRVTITLADDAEGTRLHLRHEFRDAEARDHHVQGWRYQLAVFANVAARGHHAAGLDDLLDRFFAAWNAPAEPARQAALQACVCDDVTFRDAHGCVAGRAELDAHLAAVAVHMPGLRLRRVAPAQFCQGTALVEWEAVDSAGVVRARGSNVVTLAPSGRIATVVGLWRS